MPALIFGGPVASAFISALDLRPEEGERRGPEEGGIPVRSIQWMDSREINTMDGWVRFQWEGW